MSELGLVIDVFLTQRPEDALELRNAPPSRAWLAACQGCRGPETLVAFFEHLESASSDSLLALLSKFQGHGRISCAGKVIVIFDGVRPATSDEDPVFAYVDRRPYGDGDTATSSGQALHLRARS